MNTAIHSLIKRATKHAIELCCCLGNTLVNMITYRVGALDATGMKVALTNTCTMLTKGRKQHFSFGAGNRDGEAEARYGLALGSKGLLQSWDTSGLPRGPAQHPMGSNHSLPPGTEACSSHTTSHSNSLKMVF